MNLVRSLSCILLLAWVAAAAPAAATPHRAGAGLICPYAGDGGCQHQNDYISNPFWQDDSIALTSAQTNQLPSNSGAGPTSAQVDARNVLLHHANTNIPLIDYPIGSADPTTLAPISSWPHDSICTYNTSGANADNGPYLYCQGLAADAAAHKTETIKGYDFTNGGTTCVTVLIDPAPATAYGPGISYKFVNDYWKLQKPCWKPVAFTASDPVPFQPSSATAVTKLLWTPTTGGPGDNVFVGNTGAYDLYFALGTDNSVTATTSDTLVPAGASALVARGSNTYISILGANVNKSAASVDTAHWTATATTISSQSVLQPASDTNSQVQVQNTGSVAAHVRTGVCGSVTAVLSDPTVAAGAAILVAKGASANTCLAAITASGSTTLTALTGDIAHPTASPVRATSSNGRAMPPLIEFDNITLDGNHRVVANLFDSESPIGYSGATPFFNDDRISIVSGLNVFKWSTVMRYVYIHDQGHNPINGGANTDLSVRYSATINNCIEGTNYCHGELAELTDPLNYGGYCDNTANAPAGCPSGTDARRVIDYTSNLYIKYSNLGAGGDTTPLYLSTGNAGNQHYSQVTIANNVIISNDESCKNAPDFITFPQTGFGPGNPCAGGNIAFGRGLFSTDYDGYYDSMDIHDNLLDATSVLSCYNKSWNGFPTVPPTDISGNQMNVHYIPAFGGSPPKRIWWVGNQVNDASSDSHGFITAKIVADAGYALPGYSTAGATYSNDPITQGLCTKGAVSSINGTKCGAIFNAYVPGNPAASCQPGWNPGCGILILDKTEPTMASTESYRPSASIATVTASNNYLIKYDRTGGGTTYPNPINMNINTDPTTWGAGKLHLGIVDCPVS